nr:MAG TPA: hypothetical protein [Caudoviricetes sp.]
MKKNNIFVRISLAKNSYGSVMLVLCSEKSHT